MATSSTSSTWLDRFPKYHKAAKAHIKNIETRLHKNIPAPNRGDETDDKLFVEVKTSGELVYSGKIKLRDILTRLQYLTHFNDSDTEIKPRLTIRMNILGKETKFKLKESEFNKNHFNKNDPAKMVRGRQILIYKENDEMPKYEKIMECLNTMDSGVLARSILKALDTPLNAQQKNELVDCSEDDRDNVRMFILLTHIAEAAVPSKQALDVYLKILVEDCMQNLPKHGRIPMMDKIVRAKLRKIDNSSTCTFEREFSSTEFPIQSKDGTEAARTRVLEGKELDPLSDIDNVDDDLLVSFEGLVVTP